MFASLSAAPNQELSCNPGLLNEAAEGEGWLVQIDGDIDAAGGLVTKGAYEAMLAELDDGK